MLFRTPADNHAASTAEPVVSRCAFPPDETDATLPDPSVQQFNVMSDLAHDVASEWGVVAVPSMPILTRPENGADLNTEGLYGEPVRILERKGQGPAGWVKVQLLSNNEQGWIDVPLIAMGAEAFAAFQSKRQALVSDLVAIVQDKSSTKLIPLGATVPIENTADSDSQSFKIGERMFSLQGGVFLPCPEQATRQTLVRTALSFVGSGYRWGGRTNISGVDCSGFILTSARFVGVQLPHSANRIAGLTQEVSDLSSAKAGDLLFYAKSGAERISHVGILLKYKDGRLEMLHASGVVRISTLDEAGRYDGNNDIELRKIGRII
ncbi:MAG: C40 family peptidase [Oligoflexia bacterium]|nr:C40 family peptidase [Oligoflexia bacterium]